MIVGQGEEKDGKAPPGGSGGPAETGEEAGLVDAFALSDTDIVVDPAVRALARQIGERLAVRRPRVDRFARRGLGDIHSVPFRASSDDIDVDKTLERMLEKQVLQDEDIIVRERLRKKREVVLIVDVSGSMKGERIATAAATVGAVSAELHRDDLSVIAFWSEAAVLLKLGDPVKPLELLDTLLRIPARGLTNVAFPLEVAANELNRVAANDGRVVLLSDCVHNAGPDPRPLAAKLPRLDVLLDASGEKDVDLGRELAANGGGVCRIINSHRDVAPAVTAMFADQ